MKSSWQWKAVRLKKKTHDKHDRICFSYVLMMIFIHVRLFQWLFQLSMFERKTMVDLLIGKLSMLSKLRQKNMSPSKDRTSTFDGGEYHSYTHLAVGILRKKVVQMFPYIRKYPQFCDSINLPLTYMDPSWIFQ